MFRGCMFLVAGLMASAADAADEISATYETEAGYTSNLFSDTENISGKFATANIGLRGSFDLEDGSFGFRLEHLERIVPDYRFADEHRTTASIELTKELSETVDWTLELRGLRSDSGDLFVNLPGLPIGYRTVDLKFAASTGLSVEGLGGVSQFSTSYAMLQKGTAYFEPAVFQPTKLDADEDLWELKTSHIRRLGSGELGVSLVRKQSIIPAEDRQSLERFPAYTLRGSVAYGVKLSDMVGVVIELGATDISGSEVGPSVKTLRPYVKAEAEAKLTDMIGVGVAYEQDYAIADIDDPLGEFRKTMKMVIKAQLLERLRLDVALEKSMNEWIYYDYDTQDRRLVAMLTVDAGSGREWQMEFTRKLRNESDPLSDYADSTIVSRFKGTF